ncbi:hypothetical protein RJ640_003273 [Escallonia rubra]|uniref:Uncharacterized protein n=1 Tax=Escallonia rubra TaxID=112253 RepID=A0AA88QMP1_9ASTE|nr:hypothetical protein RJ640_003273 [Escallonia rubra]
MSRYRSRELEIVWRERRSTDPEHGAGDAENDGDETGVIDGEAFRRDSRSHMIFAAIDALKEKEGSNKLSRFQMVEMLTYMPNKLEMNN